MRLLGSKGSNPLATFGCFNCDDSSHMPKDFSKPRNLARAVAKMLEYIKKMNTMNSVHVFFAHYCNWFEKSIKILLDTNDATIFECLVSTLDAHGERDNVKILYVKLAAKACGLNVFKGSCKDSGSQQFVIKESQADHYCKSFEGDRNSTGSESTYRFGNSIFHSLGVLHVRIPVTGAFFWRIS